jgi:hypothetical protein
MAPTSCCAASSSWHWHKCNEWYPHTHARHRVITVPVLLGLMPR